MKVSRAVRAVLIFGACFLATATSAKPKVLPFNDLARALAAKLPPGPGILVYVEPLSWKGKGKEFHIIFCEKIAAQLASAISAADPAAKVVTRSQAEVMLLQHRHMALDAYFMSSRKLATLLGDWTGTAAVRISGQIRKGKNGFELSAEVMGKRHKKRLARLNALFPETPELQTLFSTPDGPIKSVDGVYLAGVDGIGTPRCIYCPNPDYSEEAVQNEPVGSFLFALRIGTSGKVIDVEVLDAPIGPARVEILPGAVRAVRTWNFTPAKGPGGRPVPVMFLARIQYRLR